MNNEEMRLLLQIADLNYFIAGQGVSFDAAAIVNMIINKSEKTTRPMDEFLGVDNG